MENQLLHTMIRVFDLDKSIDFYTRHLGMKLIRRKDYPSGEFTLAFVGYGDEVDHTVIELTHNWGQKTPYDKGMRSAISRSASATSTAPARISPKKACRSRVRPDR